MDEDGNPIDIAPPSETETGTPAYAATAAPSADAALAQVRATTAAALSKELLKLGSSKVEKSIDKEFVKILSTLSFESWIHHYNVRGSIFTK